MSTDTVKLTRLSAATDVLFGANPSPSQIQLAKEALTASDVFITDRDAVERTAKSIYMSQLAVKEDNWDNLPTGRRFHFINAAMDAIRAALEL